MRSAVGQSPEAQGQSAAVLCRSAAVPRSAGAQRLRQTRRLPGGRPMPRSLGPTPSRNYPNPRHGANPTSLRPGRQTRTCPSRARTGPRRSSPAPQHRHAIPGHRASRRLHASLHHASRRLRPNRRRRASLHRHARHRPCAIRHLQPNRRRATPQRRARLRHHRVVLPQDRQPRPPATQSRLAASRHASFPKIRPAPHHKRGDATDIPAYEPGAGESKKRQDKVRKLLMEEDAMPPLPRS